MRINELILESSDLDEGIGSAIGRGIGAVGRGIGAVASVPMGFARAIKRGYQQGVGAIGGPGAGTTATPSAAAPAQPTTVQAQPGFSQGFMQGLRGTRRGTTTTTTAPTTTPAATTAPAAQASPLANKKFIGSLQALKGDDVEKVRQVLQARAGVSESLDEASLAGAQQALQNWLASKGLPNDATGIKTGLAQMPDTLKQVAQATYQNYVKNPAGWASKKIAAAPNAMATAAGKLGAASTAMKQTYQDVRGSYMTIQDIQRAIAVMPQKDAAEALQFFNSIHPQAADPAATEPADTTGTPNLKLVPGGLSTPPNTQDEIKAALDARKKAGLMPEGIVFHSKFLKMDI